MNLYKESVLLEAEDDIQKHSVNLVQVLQHAIEHFSGQKISKNHINQYLNGKGKRNLDNNRQGPVR